MCGPKDIGVTISIMDKFSITLLPGHIRLYTCTHEQFQYIVHHHFYDVTKDMLCQTRLDNEVTFYLHVLDGNAATHAVFQSICVTDPRLYRVIDIHEDIPGIDHVGIIYRISKRFVEKRIPILYVNTFGHNMVIMLEEYLSSALDVLKEIALI
jgi:hypothetical protein